MSYRFQSVRTKCPIPKLAIYVMFLLDYWGDEFHVLIECPRFTNQRINCLPENLRIKPSMFAFITYFNSLDIEVQKQLALLCFRVQKEYKQYV